VFATLAQQRAGGLALPRFSTADMNGWWRRQRTIRPGPARLLEVIAPAGFEIYFVELAEAGDPGRKQ
jgi:hypothetical protein